MSTAVRPMPASQYDRSIQIATATLLPTHYDWRLLKSQYWQESRFKQFAESPVGALGIAQFMPATWADVARDMHLPKGAKPTEVKHAINAGAFYMNKLYNIWTAPRPDMDRICLALASYNAGAGNLLKAQRKALGAGSYRDIVAHLHQVTGIDNSRETINYVDRILRVWVLDIVKHP